jgi:hypothetical protein
MHRFGKLEELVGAAVFLTSDAASYVTGHLLVVDGGMLASGVNHNELPPLVTKRSGFLQPCIPGVKCVVIPSGFVVIARQSPA